MKIGGLNRKGKIERGGFKGGEGKKGKENKEERRRGGKGGYKI